MANSREIYNGKARITAAGADPIVNEKMLAKLPPRDRDNAMELVYEVETEESEPRKFRIRLELSHRELSGRMLEIYRSKVEGRAPCQVDVAIDTLVRQGLLPKGATEADLGIAVAEDTTGREVSVSIYEDMKDDGTYWPAKGRFVSPRRMLTGNALAARFAAFAAGKPAAASVSESPAPAAVPAPDDDDMPF